MKYPEPLPADYFPKSIVVLCDGREVMHLGAGRVMLNTRWMVAHEPERLEIFWDGMLVYFRVRQQVILNRLQVPAGSAPSELKR